MTQQNKLLSLLQRAQQDLNRWLRFAGVCSIDEFHKKQDHIKKNSYHRYQDVVDHIAFIHKIEAKLGK